MILITLYTFLATIVFSRSENVDVGGWAPFRGSIWGSQNDVKCPDNGVITGIRYKITPNQVPLIINRLGFYCTSSKGETLIGPFDGVNDDTCTDDKCPQGMYVNSIYGRGAVAMDAFGVNCVKGNEKTQLSLHGGGGGDAFNDEGFVANGRKLAAIRVWAYPEVIAGIQVQYLYTPEETWAPLHGSMNDLQCPNNGVITGIRYKSTNFVNRLGIYCLSPSGETLVGPLGGANDNTCVDDKCPKGMYVKSIYGRGSTALDAFGVTCVKFVNEDEKVQLKLHGGTGGSVYDDGSFGANGKRPTAVRIFANNDLITGVQIKYSNAIQIPYIPGITDDGWAPVRGSDWGTMNEIQCPNGGVVTGIRYKSSGLMNSLGFYCTSSKGETLFGVFGGPNDNACIDERCPQGMYIKSIYGRGAAAMDAFGIKCIDYKGVNKVQLPLHGGNGGAAYDDDNWGMSGRKPSVLRVWSSGNNIVGVQIKYST